MPRFLRMASSKLEMRLREGRGWRGDRESGRVRQRSQKDTDERDRQKTGKGQRIEAEKGEVVGKGGTWHLKRC